MEKQLKEFIEENERISRQIYDRDLELERKREKNRQALERSEHMLRKSHSPQKRY